MVNFKRKIKADPNMQGGMCQHAFMDYQDEIHALARILRSSTNEINNAFFIVETCLEIKNMFCESVLYVKEGGPM
jgi:hypothetical protein